MILAAIITLATVLLPDYIIWKRFIRPKGRLWLCMLWWTPTVLLMLAVGGGVAGICHNFFMRAIYTLVFLSVIPKLLFTLFFKLTGVKVAAGIAVLTILGAVYGSVFGFNRLTVREEVFESSSIPESFDGYRIVQVSDLHVGTYPSSGKMLKKVAGKIASLQPDIVVFTGDLVNVSPDEIEPFTGILSSISAPDGVFSVLGNHDYGFTREIAAAQALEMTAAEQSLGWEVLNNGNAVLRRGADSIFVAGVENTSKGFFISRGDLTAALSGIPEGAFTILLSHDPKHWEEEILSAKPRVPLTLSGHTHAMQFKLGRISPAALMFHQWGGKYLSEDGQQMLNVSEGVGGIVPIRLGAWPEISVITLRRK